MVLSTRTYTHTHTHTQAHTHTHKHLRSHSQAHTHRHTHTHTHTEKISKNCQNGPKRVRGIPANSGDLIPCPESYVLQWSWSILSFWPDRKRHPAPTCIYLHTVLFVQKIHPLLSITEDAGGHAGTLCQARRIILLVATDTWKMCGETEGATKGSRIGALQRSFVTHIYIYILYTYIHYI